MIKLLCLITDEENEKLVQKIISEYSLKFSMTSPAEGTASRSMLEYFSLGNSSKRIYFILVTKSYEKEILSAICNKLYLNEIGGGVAFTINLTSSNKFVNDLLEEKKEEDVMVSHIKYSLVVTTVLEGYAEMVVNTAKKSGATGGTVISGRTIGKGEDNFLKLKIEPEKDIILMIVTDDTKEKIMQAITSRAGIKTEAKGVCLSLPISNVIGLNA